MVETERSKERPEKTAATPATVVETVAGVTENPVTEDETADEPKEKTMMSDLEIVAATRQATEIK